MLLHTKLIIIFYHIDITFTILITKFPPLALSGARKKPISPLYIHPRYISKIYFRYSLGGISFLRPFLTPIILSTKIISKFRISICIPYKAPFIIRIIPHCFTISVRYKNNIPTPTIRARFFRCNPTPRY